MRSLSTIGGGCGVMLQGSEQSTFLGRAASVLHLADPLKSALVDVPFILSLRLLRLGLVFIVRNYA